MSNTLTYKDFSARIGFDAEDNIFFGRLLGTSDVVGFHADTVADLRTAFEEAVDDYVETCLQLGKEPLKPTSGKMMLRVPPDVHSAALKAAEAAGTSLNQWAAKVLGEAAGLHGHHA